MKNTILYLLLFSYTSFLCKPLMPAIADCVAHIFWYSEHVATVHYENGKYHVHYENIAAAKNNLPEKNTVIKYDDASFVCLLFHQEYTLAPHISTSSNYHLTNSTLLKGFTGLDNPPPKA